MIPGASTRLSESAVNNVGTNLTIKARTDIILLWAGGSIENVIPAFGSQFPAVTILLPINNPVTLVVNTGNIIGTANIVLPIYRACMMIFSKHTQKWHVIPTL